jgi:hypothetical protein
MARRLAPVSEEGKADMAHEAQHDLEFGGSRITEEFDGTISFTLIDRIPVLTISHTFWAHTARQFRYLMNGSLDVEKPFHQSYNWAIADLRMVSEYRDETPWFLADTRDALRRLGGDLLVVTYQPELLPEGFRTFESVEEAVAAAKKGRRRR